MFPENWLDARMREITTALASLSPRGAPYALLDWPDHSNSGDSAIWLGIFAWARQALDRMPDYVSQCEKAPAELDLHCPEGVVFLHGGGNFGDLYPRINDRRVQLLETARHRRIVQLPQSIHFRDPSELARMQRAIDSHPDFTLLVRDTVSLDFARRHFACDTRLCPDMALMLGAVSRPVAPDVDVLCLMRTDDERVATAGDAPGPVVDWLDGEPRLRTRGDHWRRRIYNWALPHRRPRVLLQSLMSRQIAMTQRIAEQRMQRGVTILARGRQVVTDRLHGHILCTLMGIPHVVLDNSYGKLANFITTWPADGLTRRAATMAQARALLADAPSPPP